MKPHLDSEDVDISIDQLSDEIRNTELKLEDLRKKYLLKTGVLPPRTSQNSAWRWTIYMTLGIAYISFIVYYLGIRKTGQGEGFGIPEILYATDVQYFLILTCFIIFGMINVQNQYLRGYQVLQIFLGFWCAHWLLYDWAWWMLEIGLGRVDLEIFWFEEFYSPLLIENPPMWLFLTEAILGSFVSLYTFSVPKNYAKLAPSLLWLYTVYANASVCFMLGLNTPVTLVIGLILIGISFAFIVKNTLTFRKEKKQKEATKNVDSENIPSGPLKIPYVWIFVASIVISYVCFLVWPLIGIILSLICWYGMPCLYFLLNSIPFGKLTKRNKFLVALLCVLVLSLLLVFLNFAAP